MKKLPNTLLTTFAQQLAAFKLFLENTDKSRNTVIGYCDDVQAFAQWYETTNREALTLPAFTPSDGRMYREHLLNYRQQAPATVNRSLAALNAFARWGLQAGVIETNPLLHLRTITIANATVRWLDKAQRFALQRVVERELQLAAGQAARRRSIWRVRDATLMTVLQQTGLRVSEVAALDLADMTLAPRSGQVQVRGGKGLKHRMVPLNAQARAVLAHWLTVRPESGVTAMFISQFLGRMTTRSIERVVTEYGRKAKLEALTPHQLRHTFAKTLVDQGVSLDQVATLLGHANLNTTRIYTVPSTVDLERAVARLNDPEKTER